MTVCEAQCCREDDQFAQMGAQALSLQLANACEYYWMTYRGKVEFVITLQGVLLGLVQIRFRVWQGVPLGMHGGKLDQSKAQSLPLQCGG